MSHSEYHTPQDSQHEPPPSHLAELGWLPQWVTWRYVASKKPGGKPSKVLYTPGTNHKASTTDPTTWRSHTEAVTDVERGNADGIGFVFTDDDPYFGIDLDGCRDPETDEIEPWALAIIERFNTYTEPSPSETGVHLIGRGTKPGSDCRKGAQIECYDTERYFTVTAQPVPGYETIRNCQKTLTSWYREIWQVEPARTRTEPAAPTLSLGDHEIIERIANERSGQGPQLITGNPSAFPSASEQRWRLARKCCLYTNDTEQIARILMARGAFKDGTSERERERKARHDAERAVATYDGPRWTPGFSTASASPLQESDTVVCVPDALTCDEARAQLKAVMAENAQLRAQVEAQARMIRYERDRLQDIETILASPEVDAGARLAAVGVYLEVDHQERKGRPKGERGWQIPAAWIARRTGMTVKTANRQLQNLAKAGIIERKVVNLTKGEEAVDNDTGEIFTVDVPRKAGFIETSPGAIVTNFTEYKRQTDDAKHGGKRDPLPHCQKHPNAGTITYTKVVCRECHEPVYEGRTEQEPKDIFPPDLAATGTDDGLPMMGSPKTSVSESLDVPIMGSPDRAYVPPVDLRQRFAAGGWD